MRDDTLPPIEWPQRRVLFSFEHSTCGDQKFQPMIAQAMTEYLAADPKGEIDQFTDSNGVRIAITWPETL